MSGLAAAQRDLSNRVEALEALAARAIAVLDKIFTGVVIGILVLAVDVVVRLAVKAS